MKQWTVVEKLVADVARVMSEQEFINLCQASGVKDKEAQEWGLETLSVYGFLTA